MNFYKLLKLARLGNIPGIEDSDQVKKQRDPYRPNDPQKGEGWSKNRFGDESPGGFGGGGSNTRKGYPEGVSALDGEYDEQRDNDIPGSDPDTSKHMFIDNDIPTGEGANDNRFSDDAPVDNLKGKGNQEKGDPVGAFNQPHRTKYEPPPRLHGITPRSGVIARTRQQIADLS
jgi:hypothetical protein